MFTRLKVLRLLPGFAARSRSFASLLAWAAVAATGMAPALAHGQAAATASPLASNVVASPEASWAAQPPPSSAGIFPLAQVRRGQQGVAYTVFSGAVPEPMGVEILGVMHNAIGPGEDMILARLSGTKAEYTGVVAGMSGSPVYIDGKLAGAVAFRIGQFSKEPIAGITPIERMLEVRDLPRTPATADQAAVQPFAGGDKGTAGAAGTANTSELTRPIDTPLVFSGFSPAALDLWRTQSPVPGLEPVAGLGGGGTGEQQAEPIIPGSAVSALLVQGDLEIAATCTVTYVDASRLLACGHPITQFGAVSMPMTKANVVATLPSPLNAFKIVNTAQQVGSFTEDRQSAIGGLLGEPARMIPVTIRVTETGNPEHVLHLGVVDQPQLTPTAVLVSIFQGLTQSIASAAESSYRLRGTIRVTGYPPVELASLTAPGDAGPASLLAALEVGSRFARLYDNATRRVPIESVDLTIERLPERLSAVLERAEVDRTSVHAGEPVTVYATLRPWHGAVKTVPLTVTLPASLPEGNVRLLVSDGSALDRLTQAPHTGQPLDVAATIAQLNSQHADDRLYVTLLTGDDQAVVGGRTLSALPASMANIYEPLHAEGKAALSGESLLELTSVSEGAELSGQQVITLRVE